MKLKENVAQFVQTNCKARKLQDLRVNFIVSQRNMHYEGLQARTWKQYWADMKRSGPWADDIFVQCTAWYLGVDLCIIYAGSETGGRTSTTILGDFSPAAGERRPVLYLGYVVNNHYQSLLPQVEDNTVPEWLAQPAIDNTLQNVIRRLDEEQANLEQGSQVRFKNDTEKNTGNHSPQKTTIFIKLITKSSDYISISLAPGNILNPAKPGHT